MSNNYQMFMKTDVSPYAGEWVAICDDKVISHSTSFKEAYTAAKKICAHSKPFIAMVPKDETLIL